MYFEGMKREEGGRDNLNSEKSGGCTARVEKRSSRARDEWISQLMAERIGSGMLF